MKKSRFIPVLLFALVFCLCAGCSDKKTSGEFKVGVVAVTSGELFRKGNYIVTAARYAAENVNKSGGLELGGEPYKVKLYPADTKSNVALAVAKVCEEHKVPFITPVAGTNKLTSYKYSFRVSYTNTVQGEALALFAKNDLGHKDVGILFDSSSPYSAELARFFKEDYLKGGG
ncbi:ABC transporter substrate-binding protein, partial [Aduncisulcus paluster]